MRYRNIVLSHLTKLESGIKNLELIYNRNLSPQDFRETLEQIRNTLDEIQSYVEKEEFSPNEIK
jgi:hypothetical protein